MVCFSPKTRWLLAAALLLAVTDLGAALTPVQDSLGPVLLRNDVFGNVMASGRCGVGYCYLTVNPAVLFYVDPAQPNNVTKTLLPEGRDMKFRSLPGTAGAVLGVYCDAFYLVKNGMAPQFIANATNTEKAWTQIYVLGGDAFMTASDLSSSTPATFYWTNGASIGELTNMINPLHNAILIECSRNIFAIRTDSNEFGYFDRYGYHVVLSLSNGLVLNQYSSYRCTGIGGLAASFYYFNNSASVWSIDFSDNSVADQRNIVVNNPGTPGYNPAVYAMNSAHYYLVGGNPVKAYLVTVTTNTIEEVPVDSASWPVQNPPQAYIPIMDSDATIGHAYILSSNKRLSHFSLATTQMASNLTGTLMGGENLHVLRAVRVAAFSSSATHILFIAKNLSSGEEYGLYAATDKNIKLIQTFPSIFCAEVAMDTFDKSVIYLNNTAVMIYNYDAEHGTNFAVFNTATQTLTSVADPFPGPDHTYRISDPTPDSISYITSSSMSGRLLTSLIADPSGPLVATFSKTGVPLFSAPNCGGEDPVISFINYNSNTKAVSAFIRDPNDDEDGRMVLAQGELSTTTFHEYTENGTLVGVGTHFNSGFFLPVNQTRVVYSDGITLHTVLDAPCMDLYIYKVGSDYFLVPYLIGGTYGPFLIVSTAPFSVQALTFPGFNYSDITNFFYAKVTSKYALARVDVVGTEKLVFFKFDLTVTSYPPVYDMWPFNDTHVVISRVDGLHVLNDAEGLTPLNTNCVSAEFTFAGSAVLTSCQESDPDTFYLTTDLTTFTRYVGYQLSYSVTQPNGITVLVTRTFEDSPVNFILVRGDDQVVAGAYLAYPDRPSGIIALADTPGLVIQREITDSPHFHPLFCMEDDDCMIGNACGGCNQTSNVCSVSICSGTDTCINLACYSPPIPPTPIPPTPTPSRPPTPSTPSTKSPSRPTPSASGAPASFGTVFLASSLAIASSVVVFLFARM